MSEVSALVTHSIDNAAFLWSPTYGEIFQPISRALKGLGQDTGVKGSLVMPPGTWLRVRVSYQKATSPESSCWVGDVIYKEKPELHRTVFMGPPRPMNNMQVSSVGVVGVVRHEGDSVTGIIYSPDLGRVFFDTSSLGARKPPRPMIAVRFEAVDRGRKAFVAGDRDKPDATKFKATKVAPLREKSPGIWGFIGEKGDKIRVLETDFADPALVGSIPRHNFSVFAAWRPYESVDAPGEPRACEYEAFCVTLAGPQPASASATDGYQSVNTSIGENGEVSGRHTRSEPDIFRPAPGAQGRAKLQDLSALLKSRLSSINDLTGAGFSCASSINGAEATLNVEPGLPSSGASSGGPFSPDRSMDMDGGKWGDRSLDSVPSSAPPPGLATPLLPQPVSASAPNIASVPILDEPVTNGSSVPILDEPVTNGASVPILDKFLTDGAVASPANPAPVSALPPPLEPASMGVPLQPAEILAPIQGLDNPSIDLSNFSSPQRSSGHPTSPQHEHNSSGFSTSPEVNLDEQAVAGAVGTTDGGAPSAEVQAASLALLTAAMNGEPAYLVRIVEAALRDEDVLAHLAEVASKELMDYLLQAEPQG